MDLKLNTNFNVIYTNSCVFNRTWILIEVNPICWTISKAYECSQAMREISLFVFADDLSLEPEYCSSNIGSLYELWYLLPNLKYCIDPVKWRRNCCLCYFATSNILKGLLISCAGKSLSRLLAITSLRYKLLHILENLDSV